MPLPPLIDTDKPSPDSDTESFPSPPNTVEAAAVTNNETVSSPSPQSITVAVDQPDSTSESAPLPPAKELEATVSVNTIVSLPASPPIVDPVT